ncbi:CMP-N-acetylneuraminic acid synthetase [Legionella norrlandica]|uniref:CMP-N-acetylneuraminic acid synthetase n=1 Tax=Legionella norrlandica TaxID=1498499 RepID=A0A0A2SV99_9GAMM|nr:acylneuraminate cytidylyltransferase family protein [Legionella norrlandica]KGP63661.1 CMP-N-acetylneuraminic acid synthetase [Legionella norrlandica]
MRVLAIIPARAGSKRLPGKNIKLLSGKPLIAHTIKAALQANCCDQIVVSTDSQEIADIAIQYGASVPWLRPECLADDSANVVDAVIDLLDKYKKINVYFDSVLLLQPTSPFRKPETISRAVLMHKEIGHSVVSINKVNFKPSWYRTLDDQGNLCLPNIFKTSEISEDSEPIFKLNGAIYIATAKQIMSNKSFYSDPTKALLMDSPSESIDVDTLMDWALVEKLIELKEEILL